VYAKELPTKDARRFGGVRTNVQSVLRRPVARPVKHEKFPEPELEDEDEDEGEEEEEEEEDEDRELYYLWSILRGVILPYWLDILQIESLLVFSNLSSSLV
jgi:hypothetical protein